MGTIAVPANAEENIDDGDLLCIVLHRGDNSETDNDEGGAKQE